MKIVYVAKHDSGGNDDEGAITHALRCLGHEVECIHERKTTKILDATGDFLLLNHWDDVDTLSKITLPKVFWYFDLVDFPDPSIQPRNRARVNRMNRITPEIDLGFCTDGDWVNQDSSGKLLRLTQGADARFAGMGSPKDKMPDLLFTGIRKGGLDRMIFVNDMEKTYGKQFHHILQGTHQRKLADVIASTKIVVAPPAPVTDHYWSNRVYLTLGFGAFLLHPYCETLEDHYTDGEEIVFYHSKNDLHYKIDYYLNIRPELRKEIQQNALERTLREHTYTDRCEELVRTVQTRLNIRS